MSLSCQIKVFNSCEEIFKPKQVVNGVIKYTIYEDMTMKRIIMYLKGNGTLDLQGKTKRRFRENYVDIVNVLREESKGFVLCAGTYEDQFSFEIPENIPSSFKTQQKNSRHIIDCNIQYYIRIKFDRGYLKAEKSFKKNINVQSVMVPQLPQDLAIYKQTKLLPSIIYGHGLKGKVRIEAAIENSVVHAGDKIVVHYEIKNLSNVPISKITTKLVEMYSFKHNRPMINSKTYFDVENSTSSCGPADSGETITKTVEIDVPLNTRSLDYSTLITREYYVKISVEVPIPYANKSLRIPVQIGNETTNADEAVNESGVNNGPVYRGPPPSYWEAMGEVILEEDGDDET